MRETWHVSDAGFPTGLGRTVWAFVPLICVVTQCGGGAPKALGLAVDEAAYHASLDPWKAAAPGKVLLELHVTLSNDKSEAITIDIAQFTVGLSSGSRVQSHEWTATLADGCPQGRQLGGLQQLGCRLVFELSGGDAPETLYFAIGDTSEISASVPVPRPVFFRVEAGTYRGTLMSHEDACQTGFEPPAARYLVIAMDAVTQFLMSEEKDINGAAVDVVRRENAGSYVTERAVISGTCSFHLTETIDIVVTGDDALDVSTNYLQAERVGCLPPQPDCKTSQVYRYVF